MSQLQTLRVDVANGVVSVTLDRPDSSNAIDLRMIDDLHEVVSEHGQHEDTRVLVVRGAGRNFCAGFDMSSVGKLGSGAARWSRVRRIEALLSAFEDLPVVKLAQLHGHVVGAGLVLASCCELRYAAPDTVFSIPELDLGLPFSLRGVPRLTRLLGPTRTADMVLNCSPLPVTDAAAAALVTEVVDAERLGERVSEVAERLASRPRLITLATVNALRAANNELVAGDFDDIPQMLLALDDGKARAAREVYSR